MCAVAFTCLLRRRVASRKQERRRHNGRTDALFGVVLPDIVLLPRKCMSYLLGVQHAPEP